MGLFNCECVDKNGNVVSNVSEYVTFSVNVPSKIVGTGSDNTDHNNVTNTKRKMFMGKILVAVKPAKYQGKIIITAMSDNCGVTNVELTL